MGMGTPLSIVIPRRSAATSPESILTMVVMDSGLRPWACPGMTSCGRRSALILGGRVLDHLLQGVALHPRDIVLILEQRAQRVADHFGGEAARVELGQRGRPVQRLGDSRRLVEILVAQRLHE